MVTVASREPVSIEILFSHELVPHTTTALTDERGEMRKISKSMLKTKQQVKYGTASHIILKDACTLLCSLASFISKGVRHHQCGGGQHQATSRNNISVTCSFYTTTMMLVVTNPTTMMLVVTNPTNHDVGGD